MHCVELLQKMVYARPSGGFPQAVAELTTKQTANPFSSQDSKESKLCSPLQAPRSLPGCPKFSFVLILISI